MGSMSFLAFKISNSSRVVAGLQILILISYFTLNIVNVGEMGAALPLLVVFFILAGGGLFFQLWRGYLAIKFHFFVFLLFVAWLSFRVVVDSQDLERLKQLTVATTSGVIMFFLLGTFVRQALNKIVLDEVGLTKGLIFVFTLSSVFLFINFESKILNRSDIFYIEGADEGYQRSGNFMIMLFIINSFLYLSTAARLKTKKIASLMFLLGVYSSGMALNLVSSQMIGSNAATANFLAIYLMTIVISFLAFNEGIRNKFLSNKLALPLSRASFKKMLIYSGVVVVFGMVAAMMAIQITSFDLSKTRVFGFGADENISVSSRIEILKETGADQMGYSPIFGDVNVARVITGDAGETLHNFIPNVIAELGLVGLISITMLFILVAINLFNVIKKVERNEIGFMQALLGFWLLFLFLFLFLYANLAVGKEWSVIWFFIGFSASVFVGRPRK